MSARLIVEKAGVGVSAQDFGRPGFRALGVPLSGALDAQGLAAANCLAGAPEASAGLEILLAAPTLRVEQGPLRLGLAGDLSGLLTRADGTQKNVAGWRGLALRVGDTLALRLGQGPAYLGFSGGLDLPPVLGSRSTFARAKFGGIEGRTIVAADALHCAHTEGDDFSAPPLSRDSGPIRFIRGPQEENFTAEARAVFATAEWRASADSDRMGLRLSGPKLEHVEGGANIVSDGATPGALQVPGDGQPILLRADCQTSGGYAKIGCVIAADLARTAHVRPGDILRFAPVGQNEAAAARKVARENFARWREKISAVRDGWDAEKLWSENLISGAVSGD